MKRKRRDMTIVELNKAIALLKRPDGCTSDDLAKAVNAATIDAPFRVRLFLRRYTQYEMVARPMTPERRRKEGYIGPGSVYTIRMKGTA